MEVTKNPHLVPCDDCGKQTTNGYIIKSKKNVIRIHLCPNCLKKLLSGQIELGYNMKPYKVGTIVKCNMRYCYPDRQTTIIAKIIGELPKEGNDNRYEIRVLKDFGDPTNKGIDTIRENQIIASGEQLLKEVKK